jgi:hypothetical protein
LEGFCNRDGKEIRPNFLFLFFFSVCVAVVLFLVRADAFSELLDMERSIINKAPSRARARPLRPAVKTFFHRTQKPYHH